VVKASYNHEVVGSHFEFCLKKQNSAQANMWADLTPICQDDMILYFYVNLTCETNMICLYHVSKK
jgi:hypothetical protein